MKYFKQRKDIIPTELSSDDFEICEVNGPVKFQFSDDVPGSAVTVLIDDGKEEALDSIYPTFFSSVFLLGSTADDAYDNYQALIARKRIIVIADLYDDLLPYADAYSSFFSDLVDPVTGLKLDTEHESAELRLVIHAVNEYRKLAFKNLFYRTYEFAKNSYRKGEDFSLAVKKGMANAKARRQQKDADFQFGAKKGDKHFKEESIPLTEYIINYSKYFGGSMTDQEISDHFNKTYKKDGLETTRSTVNRYRNNLLQMKAKNNWSDNELITHEVDRYKALSAKRKNKQK